MRTRKAFPRATARLRHAFPGPQAIRSRPKPSFWARPERPGCIPIIPCYGACGHRTGLGQSPGTGSGPRYETKRKQQSQEINMASYYTPPEGILAQKRADGKKFATYGAITAGFGVLGIIVGAVLQAIFLGIIGGPLASLGWLAVLVGGGLFAYGFFQIKAAHEQRSL